MLVYGAVVVVMMLYRPQGLWPEAVVAREFEEQHVDEIAAVDEGKQEQGRSSQDE